MTPTQIDFSGVFGHHHSLSLYDAASLNSEVLSRVLIEPELLDLRVEDAPIEPWTRRLLFERLGRAGVILIGPALPEGADPRSPCPVGGCIEVAPTGALRAVAFQSGEDEVPVVVQLKSGEGADVLVAIRSFDDEESLCGDDFHLVLGYVEFSAVFQRLSDNALLATMHEVALLPSHGDTLGQAELPDPETRPEAFCAGIQAIWETAPDLARTETRYQGAGKVAMERGLVQLLTYATDAEEPGE